MMPAGTPYVEGSWPGVPQIVITNTDDYKKIKEQVQRGQPEFFEFYDGKQRGVLLLAGVIVCISTEVFPF